MKRTHQLVAAGALAAIVAFGFGCKDTARDGYGREGTGGSGELGQNPAVRDEAAPINRDVRMDEHPEPRIGDGKIGNKNGVIDDGEGPLERDGVSDDKIGKKPGVWNDGEGPVEGTQLNRPEAQ